MISPLDLARAWVEGGIVPGVAAVVVDRSGVLDELYAGRVAVAADAAAVDRDTRFALASLTKPLTAAHACAPSKRDCSSSTDEVRDGFTLRHLLSHCSGPAGRVRAISPCAPLEPPGTLPPVLERRLRAGRTARGARRRRCPSASTCARRCSIRSRWTRRSVSTAATAHVRPSCASRASGGRPAALQQRGLPRGSARRERGVRNRRRLRRASSPACSTGGVPALERCSRAETVDEMLETQFGELPGGVEAVALWDACPWGLGLDVRGSREPHWTGDSLSPAANSHFGSSGTLAWIDRERDLGLVVLANRGSYSGWWCGAGGWADLTRAVVERFAKPERQARDQPSRP